MENKYKHSKIYRLHTDDGYFYIGATTQKLCVRFQDHLSSSKYHPDRKVYTYFTHEKFMTRQVKITLIEEVECENIEQLRKKEDEHISKHINVPKCLNCNYAVFNIEKRKKYFEDNKIDFIEKRKAYNENHKEEQKVRQKEYHENNKDEIVQRRKTYRENNKEKIQQRKQRYYYNNQEKCKQATREYNKTHSEEIKIRKKEYREKNMEKIAEQKKQRVLCNCGIEVRRDGIRDHERTNKHQNWIKSQSTPE